MLLVTLSYTPDGKLANSQAPHFELVFGRMGDTVAIVTLAVLKRPAGNGILREGKADCTLKLIRLGPEGVEGTGTCTGQFEGATVSKLAFAAKP
jgi:hypothetical protein